MAAVSFCKDDDVYVFYRMSKRCTPERKYLATLDPRHGAQRPRTGMSEGWVPARVVRDYSASDSEGAVKVKYTWPHFYTHRGNIADANSDYSEWFKVEDVKLASAGPAPHPGVPKLILPGSQPELAIITFRWGGLNEIVVPGQWGATGSSVSDLFVDSFMDSAVVPRLGNTYEVWTVYVESPVDLVKLADTAHLIFGPTHPARRAKRCVSMYFLYPTAFEENCIPSRETGSDGGAALLDQKSIYRMMQSVERAGVPTKFPHPSNFYESLTSKRWTSMMSTTPHLRVPPTVSLPRMLVETSCAEAAERGLAGLTEVKKFQAQMNGDGSKDIAVMKGVAKLGFSWEALDVKFWKGEDGLAEALSMLTQAIEISGELTGQPHDLESIILQEYCDHDLELRLYVVDGKVESSIYTKFCSIKDNNEFGDFHESFAQEDAARDWMGNDVAALQDGERQCREVTQHWLTWVQSQICDLPPAIRFDYFVGRTPGKAGSATIWTLEICELGFSMLGDKDLPDKVFAAMLRSMLGERPGAPAARSPASPKWVPKTPAAIEEPVAAAPAVASEASDGPTKKNGKQPSKGAKSGGTSDIGMSASEASPVLYVLVPPFKHGTSDQQACTGTYYIEESRCANGHPLWRNSSGDRWLYMGTDGAWYVGDEEEEGKDFECDQGYIRHQASEKTMPYDLEGPWSRGPDWKNDKQIAVSLDGSILSASQGERSKGKGKRR